MRLSDLEVQGMLDLGRRQPQTTPAAMEPEPEDPAWSPEQRAAARKQRREEEQQRLAAERSRLEEEERRSTGRFIDEIESRLQRAYAEGRRSAVDESSKRDALFRGYVLYVVVGAVVLLPFLAIVLNLKPETFGSYVAPVTGIAGTIVGYWFGSAGERGRAGREPDRTQAPPRP